MDVEKLLECVRKYPVIYDMSHPKYLDNKYKNIIWKTISDEIKQSDDVCKKRWANIRDQFKKHRNKRKTKSGQGAVAIKKYKYEESLNFLLSHTQDRNTITSIESENEETQNETVTSPVTTPNETINTDEQQQQEDRSPAISEPNFTPPADPNPYPPSTAQFTRSGNRNRNATVATAHNRRRIVPQSQSSASIALMAYILKNKEKSNTQDIHPIDAFFNGLAATIKSFSPYYQHLAKGRIFAVVQDLEWEQLSSEPSSYTSSMSGTTSASSTNSRSVYAPVPMTTPTPTPESTPTEPTPSEPSPSELTPLESFNLSTLFSEFTAD